MREDGVEVDVFAKGAAVNVFSRNALKHRSLVSINLETPWSHQLATYIGNREPDLVLTGTSCSDDEVKVALEQQIVDAARKTKKPSLGVLGMWERDYGKLFNDEQTTGGKHRFLPDKIALLDDIMNNSMLTGGFPADQLVVTGNPYFDDLAELRDGFSVNGGFLVRGDLGMQSPMVTFASQPIEHHYGDTLGYTEKTALKDLLQGVANLQEKGTNFNVLVKAHPRENKVELESLACEFDVPIVVDQAYDTRQAILASEVVVSMFSTVLVESTYLDRISVSLQPGMSVEDDRLITNALGVTHAIYEPGKIGDFLGTVSSHVPYVISLADARKKFQPDGNATQRVEELAYSMIK